MPSDEEIERDERIRIRTRYVVGQEIRRRKLLGGCLACLVLIVLGFAGLLWLAYHVFPS